MHDAVWAFIHAGCLLLHISVASPRTAPEGAWIPTEAGSHLRLALCRVIHTTARGRLAHGYSSACVTVGI